MADSVLTSIEGFIRSTAAAPALLTQGSVMSFGALGGRVQAVLDLLDDSAETGPVMVCGHKEPDVVAAMIACMFIGRPFVFIDRSNPADRVARIQRLSGARLALVAGVPPVLETVRHVTLEELQSRELTRGARRQVDPEALLYYVFTSGSTGEPKGVPISRANFEAFGSWYSPMLQDMAGNEQSRSNSAHVNHASLAFDMGMLDLWPVLGLGRPVILLDHRHNVMPRKNVQAIIASDEVGARSWFSTPSLLQLMCTDPWFSAERLPWLRVFYVGGEVVQRSQLRQLRQRFPKAEIRHAYGPSEGTCMSHVHVLTDADIDTDGPLPLGQVLAPNMMRIIGRDGREMPSGVPGEVELSGPQITRGYVPADHPANKAFSNQNGVQIYRTGDHGYLDAQGNLMLLGRVDRQVKWNGNRIELDEIERAAHALAEVDSAACLPVKEDGRVTSILLFVKQSAGGTLNATSCATALAEHLPQTMIPRDIRFVSHFPVTVNGKIDAKALLTMPNAVQGAHA